MQQASPTPANNSHAGAEVPSRLRGWLIAVLLATGAVACGPTDAAEEPPKLARQTQSIEGFNGLSLNGLSANGLSLNGLSLNGLSLNGLSVNGLSASIFSSWFEQAPSHSDMVMRYVVLCALPPGQSLTYTQPQTQVTHTWYGRLGLAPVWASGQPPPLVEQHLISACLAAHANKYGVSVPISVLGEDSAGQPIPFTEDELHEYSRKDGCFFGNVFTDEGLFFGTDGGRLHDHESSTRACALTSEDPSLGSTCSPMVYMGKCKEHCEKVDGEKFYESCTVNGVTYRTLTTRVRKEDIYDCGDGICQLTEACGSGKQSRSCEKDCGRCPDNSGSGSN